MSWLALYLSGAISLADFNDFGELMLVVAMLIVAAGALIMIGFMLQMAWTFITGGRDDVADKDEG